jgi:hypothetical protein
LEEPKTTCNIKINVKNRMEATNSLIKFKELKIINKNIHEKLFFLR